MADLQYVTTSREYVEAKHALENAWQRLVRSSRVKPPASRRPVGASAEFQIPSGKPGPKHYDLNNSMKTFAFDPMTGELKPSALQLHFKGMKVSTGNVNIPDIWEPAARKLYENARKHYLEAKARYFKKDTAEIRRQMHDTLSHEANLQLLGADSDGAFMEGLQHLANDLCIDAVREYNHSPGPNTARGLLVAVAEAQLTGADHLAGVQVAQKMVNDILSH